MQADASGLTHKAPSQPTELTPAHPTTLSPVDIVGYLFGDRSAIHKVLQCKTAWLYGAALVFTAAVAREYDAVSLLHQPWELLGPFVASLALATGIFVFVNLCNWLSCRKPPATFSALYRQFLTAYWWTAPLAWLYAVPIEMMTSELNALAFNLTMLSVVSIWRVLLFSRVVGILYRVPMWAALTWILIPCMVVAFFALLNRMLSLVSVMGGIRLTQTQQMLQTYQSHVIETIFYAAIPTLMAGIAAIWYVAKSRNSVAEPQPEPDQTRLTLAVWIVPVAALLALGFGLGYFQPLFVRAHHVDRLLESEKVTEAIQTMQEQGERRFPVVWDPPPRFPNGNSLKPNVAVVASAIHNIQPDAWIARRLLIQADEIALRQIDWHFGARDLHHVKGMLEYHEPSKLEQLDATLKSLEPLTDPNSKEGERIRDLIPIVEQARIASQEHTKARSADAEH